MFVSGVKHLKQETIQNYFSTFGEVKEVIVKNQDGDQRKRPYAFVICDDHEVVDRIVGTYILASVPTFIFVVVHQTTKVLLFNCPTHKFGWPEKYVVIYQRMTNVFTVREIYRFGE